MEHSLTVNTTEAGVVGFLTFEGEMSLGVAWEIKQALSEAIDAVDLLNIDLQKIRDIDVSSIQLLCSAHRECFLSGKTVHVQSGGNDSIAQFLERAGYRKQLGCLSEAKGGCIWENRS